MPFLCQKSRLFVSILVGILSGSECVCTALGMFYDHLGLPPLQNVLRRMDQLILGVIMSAVVGIVYVRPIEPQFLCVLSNVCHQPLWQ